MRFLVWWIILTPPTSVRFTDIKLMSTRTLLAWMFSSPSVSRSVSLEIISVMLPHPYSKILSFTGFVSVKARHGSVDPTISAWTSIYMIWRWSYIISQNNLTGIGWRNSDIKKHIMQIKWRGKRSVIALYEFHCIFIHYNLSAAAYPLPFPLCHHLNTASNPWSSGLIFLPSPPTHHTTLAHWSRHRCSFIPPLPMTMTYRPAVPIEEQPR